MTSTTPRIIIIALAVLALAAPAAFAMPVRGNEGVQTSSLAGTTSAPERDWRNPDERAPIYVPPAPQQHKPKIAHLYVPPVAPQPTAPATVHKQQPAAVAADDGTSPFLYIVPGLALIALLGTGVALMRPSRHPAHA